MDLEGQGGQRGYAMAALLVGLGVIAVLMSAAMPVWRHEAQRERETEVIFRGKQIARAVAMYREKNAGSFPTSLDILVQQRFLRKKFKNLIDEDGEWQPISGLGTTPQQQPGLGRGRGQTQPGLSQPTGVQQAGQGQGIMGVTLKDKGSAIIEWKRATHHNEWTFMFSDARTRIGASQGGRGAAPGMGPGTGPGRGRGGQPQGPGRGGPGIGGPGIGGPGMGPGRGRGFGPGGGPMGGGRRGGGN